MIILGNRDFIVAENVDTVEQANTAVTEYLKEESFNNSHSHDNSNKLNLVSVWTENGIFISEVNIAANKTSFQWRYDW